MKIKGEEETISDEIAGPGSKLLVRLLATESIKYKHNAKTSIAALKPNKQKRHY